MKIEQVIARAQRNSFQHLAGASYRDPESALIRELKWRGKSSILGIQNESGAYTVIGFEGLLIKNMEDQEVQVPLEQALLRLQENGMHIGKGGDFEYVDFKEYGHVWMKDGPTMCAIWNIIMLLEKQPT